MTTGPELPVKNPEKGNEQHKVGDKPIAAPPMTVSDNHKADLIKRADAYRSFKLSTNNAFELVKENGDVVKCNRPLRTPSEAQTTAGNISAETSKPGAENTSKALKPSGKQKQMQVRTNPPDYPQAQAII